MWLREWRFVGCCIENGTDMIILDVNLQREGEGFQMVRRLQQASAASIVVREHINGLRVRFARARLDARIDTAHARGYRLVTADRMSPGRGAG